MEIVTADLCDKYAESLSLLQLYLKTYGQIDNFFGKIVTLKVYEDNTLVRKLLETDGSGKVLVIDGGGSKRCALVGDNLAQLAIDNQWSGIVVYGCIRDSKEINTMAVGIKALGTCPVKSIKRDVGLVGETLLIEGTTIANDQYLYADQDGVLIADKKLV